MFKNRQLKPRCSVACGCKFPDYKRNGGIKLAGRFDQINSGMSRKTLFVSNAYFRNPKAFENMAWFKEATQSGRGFTKKKERKKETSLGAD